MKHELKVIPTYFKALWCGDKTFEIRNNDRGFQERDEICLQEFDDKVQEYTGREINGFIRYLTDFGQKDGWIVFSFQESGRSE